jgi:peptidase E
VFFILKKVIIIKITSRGAILLYVTSNSFLDYESKKEMEKILKEKNVKQILIIDDAEPDYISATIDYFQSLGIESYSLTLSKTDKEEANLLINNASVIYLSGGNPYPLGKEIKQFKDEITKKVLSSVDIVIGASAGAMVLGKEFYLAELLEPGSIDGFSNEDNQGINILDEHIVFPHCDEFAMPVDYKNKEKIIFIYKNEFYHLYLSQS